MRRRLTPSPSLARLGLATPPPFVGRTQPLSWLRETLISTPILIVTGAVGAGKTRLAEELRRQLELGNELQVTRVACAPGDLGVAAMARSERAMDCMPGSLPDVLSSEPRLLILDDVHHLPTVDLRRLIEAVAAKPGPGRLLLLTRDLVPVQRNDSRIATTTIEGLEEGAARDLWLHLEELYGPTLEGACDAALGKTRGMPLALRREYARSIYGEGAWELHALCAESRAALEALCVLRLPAGPAAVAALLDGDNSEAALIDLVSRQLIDPLEHGRFLVHDVVRDQVLEAIEANHRANLEERAVALVENLGRGKLARRPAWTEGDDGAIAILDAFDRSREVVLHWIGAGRFDRAIDELVEVCRGALARGAAGELSALIERIRDAGHWDERLAEVSASIAVRRGEIADALELRPALAPSFAAYLSYRNGQVSRALCELEKLALSDNADTSADAAISLSELYLDKGDIKAAEKALHRAFAQVAGLNAQLRASLHLAFASVENFNGNTGAARAALSRAARSADDSELSARVSVRRLRSLAAEERYGELTQSWESVRAAVAEVDCIPLHDELARCAALVACQIGNAEEAARNLEDGARRARERGDEIGALRTELQLVESLLVTGHCRKAAELLRSVRSTCQSLKLEGLGARAALLDACVASQEMRFECAAQILNAVGPKLIDTRSKKLLDMTKRTLDAWSGKDSTTQGMTALERAYLYRALGNGAASLEQARQAAVDAERLGQNVELAFALSLVGRYELSRGDSDAARTAASRAAREGGAHGVHEPRVISLLVLAAVERDVGDLRSAALYARDARELAADLGFPVYRAVAARALEVISRDDGGPSPLSLAGAATLDEPARMECERLMADLGLSDSRPYRCVYADGRESMVAAISPDLLGVKGRTLVVDAVEQLLIRNGDIIADLRRRSLLKRLLFLFASAPLRVFSKEEIVEKVWEVEYHPLRHDAALFTNIMRIRRLLGEDGNDIIRVGDDGYSLCPPEDFLYVEDVSSGKK